MNIFSILASGNREIYFDALMLLNEYLKQNLSIGVSDYAASLSALIEDRNFIVEKACPGRAQLHRLAPAPEGNAYALMPVTLRVLGAKEPRSVSAPVRTMV